LEIKTKQNNLFACRSANQRRGEGFESPFLPQTSTNKPEILEAKYRKPPVKNPIPTISKHHQGVFHQFVEFSGGGKRKLCCQLRWRLRFHFSNLTL
jgi:hypothetical protein